MKKFFTVISCFILFIALGLLTISISIKSICVKTLSTVFVSKEVSERALDVIYDIFPEVSVDQLGKIEENIRNSDVIDDITEKYFDDIINKINNGDSSNIPNTKEDIEKIVDDNIDFLRSMNINVTSECKNKIIDRLVNTNALNDVYETVSNNITSNMTTKQQVVVNTYNIFNSKTLKAVLLSIIIIFTLLITLINKSIYKVFKSFGITLLILSIFILAITPLVVNVIESRITNNTIGRTASIDYSSLTRYGIFYLVISILLISLYIMISKLTKKKQENNN